MPALAFTGSTGIVEDQPKHYLEPNQFQELTIEEKVSLYLGEDMLPVINCESEFRQFDKDGKTLESETGDVGISQISPIWFEEAKERNLDIWNSLDDNLIMARHIIRKQGKSAWVCHPDYKGEKPERLKIEHYTGGQCVDFVQYVKGENDGFIGNARDIKPNSDVPLIGQVVLTSESEWGHVALIDDIQDGDLILIESNYNGDGKVTKGRRLAINSPLIRGYYHFQ